MTEVLDVILIDVEEKMEKALSSLERGFSNIRTGVANPAMLDRIYIDYYGVATPLKQISSITVIEGRQLFIKPFDKSTLKLIEQTINTSDLNLPPQNDGTGIRLFLPQLTEARRKDLVKEVEKTAEQGKVGIRNARRDGNDQVKKEEFPEDTEKNSLDQIQDLTDAFIVKIDELTKEKTVELLKI